MFKKLILLLCSLITFVSYSFAANEFSITTESDSKDYIGGGKGRKFSSSNKDKLIITNADTKNAQFSVESFNLGTPMNFTFGVEDGKTLIQGLYDPAKRHPFRGSYNGIDVSGDGRGCNTIVGKFYVHEYSVSSNGIVDKAAIDFVQYCEGGTAGLYGSIRYNSSIASSCAKAGSCEGVKKVLNISSSTSNNTNSPNQSSADMKSLQKMYKKHYKTFTSFMQGEYNMTYKKDFKNINKYCKVNKLFDTNENSTNFFTNNACGTTYNNLIEEFNAGFNEGQETGGNEDFNKEGILGLRKIIIDLQNERKKNKLTMKEDMTISIAILGMIRADYIIHDMLFSI